MIRINAAKVRELFARERLTDLDAARRTGLGFKTVKKIQVDGARTQWRVLVALCKTFQVSIDELILGGTDNA